jgi:hypothetical protein
MWSHIVQLWNDYSACLIDVNRLAIQVHLPYKDGVTVYMCDNVSREKCLLTRDQVAEVGRFYGIRTAKGDIGSSRCWKGTIQ